MLGLLPWEKWLPPYVLGPLICLGSIYLLLFSNSLHWWSWVLLPPTACFGAWATWIWITTGRNIFETDEQRAARMKREQGRP
jgi:hypothetical protein